MHTISGEPAHTIDISLEGGKTRYSFFDTDESVLKPLMDDLFAHHWSGIIVGAMPRRRGFRNSIREGNQR